MSDKDTVAFRIDRDLMYEGFFVPATRARANFIEYVESCDRYKKHVKSKVQAEYLVLPWYRKMWYEDAKEYARKRMYSMFCMKLSFVKDYNITDEQELVFSEFDGTISNGKDPCLSLFTKLSYAQKALREDKEFLDDMSIYLTQKEADFIVKFERFKLPEFLQDHAY